MDAKPDCETLRAMLAQLSEATETYASYLHWSSEGAYSKAADEKPWRDTQRLAATLVAELAASTAPEALSHGRPGDAAEVTAMRDRYAGALTRLVEANDRYWNRMTDDDRGRSFENKNEVPQWEAARAAAREAIGTVTPS